MNRINVDSLQKIYPGGFAALNGISFSVAEGEVFGLLGPNGAGKSTTLRILATILPSSGGIAEIMGNDVAGRGTEARRAFGFVPQDTAVDDCLTGFENLYLHARLHGLPRKTAKARTREVLAFMSLEKRAGDKTQTYSGGMRKRLEIACALIHKPLVLLLDEPTLGLDIWSRHEIWALIDKMKRESGVSVLLSTHYLEEADRLCDRVAILKDGVIALEGRPNQLKDEAKCEIVSLELIGDMKARAAAMAAMRSLPGLRELRDEDGAIVAAVACAATAIPLFVEAARSMGARVERACVERPGLDGVFLDAMSSTDGEKPR